MASTDTVRPAQSEAAPWAGSRTTYLRSLSLSADATSGSADSGAGRTVNYYNQTPATAANQYGRIGVRQDLKPNTEVTFVDAPINEPGAGSPVPDVVLPANALVADPDAFSKLDENGYRIPTPGTVANPGQATRPSDQQGGNQQPTQPAQNQVPQQNQQPVQNQQPAQQNPQYGVDPNTMGAQTPVDPKTQPGRVEGQPIAPAQPAEPPLEEGVPRVTPVGDDGSYKSTVMVEGTGGQTIDTTTYDAQGNPIETHRAVVNDQGGVTVWTAHADGSHSVTYIGSDGKALESYRVPAGGDLVNGATEVTTSAGDGIWVTKGVNPDGTPSTKVVERLPDGITYYETEVLPGGGSVTTATRPGSREFSTPWVVGESNPDRSGWIYLPSGAKEITRPDGSTYIEGQLANTVAELNDPGFSTSERTSAGDTITMMPWEEARRIADADAGKAWSDAKSRDRGPMRDPGYIDTQWRLYALEKLKGGDPNVLVKVTVSKDGKYQYSVVDSITGAERIVTTINDEFAQHEPFEFTRQANGDLTDRNGNRLITVNGRLLHTDSSGNLIMPDNPSAEDVYVHGYANGSDSVHEIGFSVNERAALGIGPYFSKDSKFVTRADDPTHYEIARIPVPAGVNALELYRSADGGLLYKDASGLHWATDPGMAPTTGEVIRAAALELVLLAAGEGVGWAVGKGIAYGVNAIRGVRTAAQAAADTAETAAASSANASVRNGTGATGNGVPAATGPKLVVTPPATNRVVNPAPAEVPPAIAKTPPVPVEVTPSGFNVGRAGTPANPHTTFPTQSASIPARQVPFEAGPPVTNSIAQTQAAVAGELKVVITQAETLGRAEANQLVTAGGRNGAEVINMAGRPRGGGTPTPRSGGNSGTGGSPSARGGGNSGTGGSPSARGGGNSGGATGGGGGGGTPPSGPSSPFPPIYNRKGGLVPRVDVRDPRLRRWPPLTTQTYQGRKYIIDKYGVPHRLGGSDKLENVDAVTSMAYLNRELRKSGLYYDKVSGSGSRYLIQDEAAPLIEKGLLDDTVVGSTSDLIKVTWKNGNIVRVESFDSTGTALPSANRSAARVLQSAIDTVTNKLAFNGKYQTQNVVYVAKNETQAREVFAHFADNPNVRVIHPASGFDRVGFAGPLPRQGP
ncbi:hypothetical protein [Nocardia sp. NPDC052566]|uniref:hypothetical protein n=1 Tax=Nocardia sp. NPDC052566 TaxID=3364330 RepID=UPI0037C73F42